MLTTSPRRRHHHRRRHRRQRFAVLALIVVLILGVADLGWTDLQIRHLSHQSDIAARTVTGDENTLGKTKFQLAVMEQRILAAQRSLFLGSVVLNSATDTENSEQQGLSLQAEAINTLANCLSGVRIALNDVENSRENDAVTALATVSSACETLDAATPGGAVYPYDFADPDIVRVGSTYYGYGTNSATGNVQIIDSTDLLHWTPLGDALPQLGTWAQPGYTWAPDVVEVNGQFLLYYTADNAATQSQCISVATSDNAAGPFVDGRGAPLICQHNLGGAIDADAYTDDNGNLYLSWKSIGGNDPATIWAAELTANGQAFESSPTVLIRPTLSWENGVVEGPTMVNVFGNYYLFYSANIWQTASYATGVAECSGPEGPCNKASHPILSSSSVFEGPGGPTVFTDPSGQLWIGFHAWAPGAVGPPNPRLLFIRKLVVNNGAISIAGPP